MNAVSLLIVLFWGAGSIACWKGYQEDYAKTKTIVYAKSNYNNSSYAVGKLSSSQKICVSETTDHGYAEVKYEDPEEPNISKFGFVNVANLKSVRTEAIGDCAYCIKELGDFSYASDSKIEIQDKPLPYADRIMENVKYGLAFGRTGLDKYKMCGRAVSRILRATGLLPGAIGDLNVNGGFDGKDGFEFLSLHGFVDDQSACHRPGVVLIYDKAKPGYGGRRGTRNYLKGDDRGHVEILGSDGKYYFYTANGEPMDEILGKNRRPLLHCMVSKVGMSGGSL